MFFDPPGDTEGETPEPRFPNRLFARIDQIEPDEDEEDGGATVLLDCVSSDWIEKFGYDTEPIAMRAKGQSEETGIDGALFILAISLAGFRKLAEEVDRQAWYQVELGEADHWEDVSADQYSSLFSDHYERGVIGIRKVEGTLAVELDRIAGWGNAHPSSLYELNEVLHLSKEIDAIAIYDVGQGAATALLCEGIPQIYFDFGGSVIGNWRSFPRHLKHFCFTDDPVIVLSHWDWDHWSSALRDRRALRATWILPLQIASGPMGAVHARFLSLLNQNGRVLWWDATDLDFAINSQMCVAFNSANGPVSDRNQSGITLTIKAYPDASGEWRSIALLPGDASLEHCRDANGTHFEYLMVPHHGGRTGLATLPGSRRNKTDHLIYSYGAGNIFLHPLANTVKAFRKNYPKNVHAALRNHTGFGHVGIDLSGNTLRAARSAGQRRLRAGLARLGLPCGHRCNLEIQQWI